MRLEEDLEVHQPRMKYKLAFLIGGVLFALLSYLVGTILYQIELDIAKAVPLSAEGIAQALGAIWSQHLLTFVPWMMGTTALSVALGYLFDRERQLRRVVEAMAVTDSLTLLYNRRYLMQQLALEVERVARRVTPAMAVLMIDIDDFKRHNDIYGHLAGDNELRRLATAIRQVVRQTDIVARYGGEEIVVVAIGTDKDGALKLGERIRQAAKANCAVTVSIGVSSHPENGQTVDALLSAADDAMYEAKRRGKDQVYTAAPRSEAETTESE